MPVFKAFGSSILYPMKWRHFINEQLGVTRKDRIGIMILSILMLIVSAIPHMIASSNEKPIHMDTTWIALLKDLELKNDPGADYFEGKQQDYVFEPADNRNTFAGELFYFDPNTIGAAEWKRLGLRERTIETILKYVGKGGRFKKPGDIQRIYGLRKDQYERLLPYVRIGAKEPTNDFHYNESGYAKPKKEPLSFTTIDINSADTADFISLPGIGSKLAGRIVAFREKLGGFYQVEQVAETYGLPDSTFQKIKPRLKLDHAVIKKININTATKEELRAHPYIRYVLATPIVAYREQHGLFAKLEDIKNIMAVTNDIYRKIEPYLTLE